MSGRVTAAGDAALVVEFGVTIDPGVNALAIAAAKRITRAQVPGVRDVVPTYRSVAVYFDPLKTDRQALATLLERESTPRSADAETPPDPIRVPVCYGGDLGPDLGVVARRSGLRDEDVIRIHVEGTYRVFMLGFVPGFAYLATVDARIAAPRLDTPRVKVPAGSVGIAGSQTGIYPMETPGGWQLIGRTPLKPFDPDRASPCLFEAGDYVRFYAIDRPAFDAWDAARAAAG
jgi:inhibitor of KinA